MPEPDERPNPPRRPSGLLEDRHALLRLPGLGLRDRGNPTPPVVTVLPPPPAETPPPPPPSPPVNTALPTIAGTATEGQALSASSGTWSGSPTSYAYQWQGCNALGEGCLSVGGATAQSYTLAASDVGGTMRVVVTASNAGGSTPASSAATAAVVPAPPPPPPPPAPTNTALPTVSGSAVEGQTLSASNGSWTGSPTSYAYQWQDCNSSGESCVSISGATASSYKLAARDVGSTMRVVVTASNAGGSTPASSAATAVVVPAPPPHLRRTPRCPLSAGPLWKARRSARATARWTGSPTSYAYQWQDCNSSGESCVSISGATASSYKLAVKDVGSTMRMVVTASNTGGSTPASSAATAAVVAAPPPPPPPAPTNTAPPSISGSAVEGQTLSASNGSWTGSPTSYAYQWQDCNALGEGCLSVSGATASSYTLAASDVGGTVRVVVTASNSAGSALAPSAQTAMISKGGGQQTKCFPNPEACGYPGPNDTGPEAGVKLTEASGEVVLHNNEHYENKKLIGKIRVEGENDVIKNDEILTTGTCPTEECSSSSILQNSGNNLTIDHVRAGGTATHGANRANESITTFATNVTIEWSNIAYNSGGSTIDGGGTIAHDYCNMEFFKAGEHYECIDDDSLGGIGENEPPIIVKESTLYNPHSLTSVLFYKAEAAELKEVRIENNLLAGGGYTISIGPGGYKRKGPEIITGNRFARACEGKATKEGQSSKWFCASQTINYTEENASPSIDGDGYYPLVGAYGYWAGGEQSELKWSGNYFDENLEEATVGG